MDLYSPDKIWTKSVGDQVEIFLTLGDFTRNDPKAVLINYHHCSKTYIEQEG